MPTAIVCLAVKKMPVCAAQMLNWPLAEAANRVCLVKYHNALDRGRITVGPKPYWVEVATSLQPICEKQRFARFVEDCSGLFDSASATRMPQGMWLTCAGCIAGF